MVGIDVHIGSQLTELEPFRLAYRKVAELTETLRADGHDIRRLDLGGGLGIPYARSNEAPPLPAEYGAMIREELGHLGCEIEIEPGRLIVGNAGILVSRVIYLKSGEGRDFLILDAAMNDLIRPAMYDAHHDIVPVQEAAPGSRRRRSTSSGRSANRATPSRARGCCRPGRGRSGGLSQRRRLWRGHVERVQHAAARPRGSRQRGSIRRDPRTAEL